MRVSGPRAPLHGDGGVGQALFQPALAEGVPLVVGQVSRRGGFQEGQRQARLPCPGGGHPSRRRAAPPRRAGVAVPGQQFRRPGQELTSLPRRPADRAASSIRASCRQGKLAHLRRVERGGHRQRRARPAGLGPGRAGPHRQPGGRSGRPRTRATQWPAPAPGPGRVAQQLPKSGGATLLAHPPIGGVEVELGLVQPDHGLRPDARQLPRAPHRGGTGRSGATAATAGPGPAAASGPPSRPRSCLWTTRRPAPRSRSGRQPPCAPLGPAPGHARAAHTGGKTGSPGAHPRAAPAGAPPGRTGRSPPPATAPPLLRRCPGPRPLPEPRARRYDAGRNLVGKVGDPFQDLRRRPADERRHLDDRIHVQLAAPVQGRVVERAAHLAKPSGGLRPELLGAQPAGPASPRRRRWRTAPGR